MKRLLVSLSFLIFLIPQILHSQAISTSKLAWSEDAPTLSDAQSYTYRYYSDGASVGTPIASVVCTGITSPFQCEAPFPAFTPGNHTITLTAGNLAGESGKTSPLDFTFIVTPAIPTGLRIK